MQGIPIRAAIAAWRGSDVDHLIAAAAGQGFLDGLFDSFTGFARALLNPANQFILLALGILEIAFR